MFRVFCLYQSEVLFLHIKIYFMFILLSDTSQETYSFLISLEFLLHLVQS